MKNGLAKFCHIRGDNSDSSGLNGSSFEEIEILVGQTIFRYTLGRQLVQNILEIIIVRVSVPGQVTAELRLVVDFVPRDCVLFAGGGASTDSER